MEGRVLALIPGKKRAWCQVHLSTCLVLMIVASAFVWLNVTECCQVSGSHWTNPFLARRDLHAKACSDGNPGHLGNVVRGWPLSYELLDSVERPKYEFIWGLQYPPVFKDAIASTDLEGYEVDAEVDLDPCYLETGESSRIVWKFFLVDVLAGLAILAFVGIVLELPIRRRGRAFRLTKAAW